MPVKATPAAPQQSEFLLERLNRRTNEFRIVGTAPLIVHRFDEKAKRMMLDAQQKKTKVKEAKDPLECFERSRYRLDDKRDGFPAVGFKAAIVNAATLFDGVTKVALKQAIFVPGEGPEQLIAIDYESMDMREDNVRVGMGTADLRFRAQYSGWSAGLRITFLESVISVESLASLVDAAGMGGIGEWRPSAPKSSTGSFGTFELQGF